MIPDFEKRLNDRMNEASLKELMPDFDQEQEWQQLSQRLQPGGRRFRPPVWAYAAAMLVLCSVAGLVWFLQNPGAEHATAYTGQPADNEQVAVAAKDTNDISKEPAVDTIPAPKATVAVVKKTVIQNKATGATDSATATDVIYNGTPCPIEVRISQVMNCPNSKPKAVSSSSTLAPDQSGQLNYKETNTIARNCSLTLKEIEIKSTATGEVILLNSSSLPATAQEVFSYITGEKKGDVLAGVFNYDCNKKNRKHNVRLGHRNGNLVIE